MRNLKRALSLVLAVVMVIGLMVVGASAVSYNDFSDREEIVNKDAVSMLTTLEIIQGLPDGSYDPTGNVDRAQMAKMISVTLTNNQNCDTLYTNVDSGLTDIAANWARGFINYCYVRGIIAGRGDNTFDPSANVTGVEAAKMLLAALGYNAEIEGLVGPDWALNTAALAQQLGIFRNFTKDVSEPLNRDDAALLIYNALDVEMIQQYSNGYALVYGDHRTILSSVFGVIRVEGVVAGNEWAQLQGTNSDAALREGRTILEDVVWYDSTTANTVVEEGVKETQPVPFNVTTPVEYIGKAVTLYVEKTTILSNSKVIGVATNDDMNVIQTNVSTEDTSKDYLKGTGVAIDSDTDFYVNYGHVESETAAIDLINEHTTYNKDGKFDLNGIEVEVIDNNDDGTAEYVLYLVETLSEVARYSERNEELAFYTPYDKNGKLVTSKNSSTPATATRDLADVVYAESVSLGGVVTTDALDLATDDLILYVEYGGRTYVYLPEIVTGTMTRVDRDKDNELYITIDDADEYRQSFIMDAASLVDVDVTRFDITNAKNEPGFDTAYDFILDSNGYVIAIRPAEEVVTNYALVIESAWSQNALTRSGEVTILTAEGLEETYTIDWNDSREVFGYDDDKDNDSALENYLGTRDVQHNGTYATGAAIGTVITYSLNEAGDKLTIENIMNQNGLVPTGKNDAGYTSDTTGTKGENIPEVDVDSEPIVYIDKNFNSIKDQSTQYKVGTKDKDGDYTANGYDTGDGTLYLTVTDATAKDAKISYAIDKDTVAFYFVGTGDGEYGVATGWDKMSDVAAGTAAQVYPVLEKDGKGGMEATRLADVVMFNSAPTNDSNDYMLVLDANHLAKDELWLNVVFEDGTTGEVEIDSKGGYNFDDEDSYMKAYAYSENADGTYDISSKPAIGAYDGTLIRRDTVNWAGATKYLTIVGSTHVWDVTDVSRADEDVTAGSFNDTVKNAVVIRGGSRQENIRTAWVWEKDVDSDEGYVSGVYKPNVHDVDGNVITIRKYAQDTLSTNMIRDLIRNGLEKADVDKVTLMPDYNNGHEYVAYVTNTDDDVDFYYVDLENVRRVTYNGKDYFKAKDETIELNSDVALRVLRTGGEITGYAKANWVKLNDDGTGYVWYQKDAVTDGYADEEIVDGWKVGGSQAQYAVENYADMVNVGGERYWPAGENVVLTSSVPNRTITVTYGDESKSFGTVTGGEKFDFEMPAHDIIVTVDDTPQKITINYVDNTTHGKYMWGKNPETGYDDDDSFEVVVYVEEVPSQDVTLTLTGSSGSISKTATVSSNPTSELSRKITFTIDLTGATSPLTLTLTSTP